MPEVALADVRRRGACPLGQYGAGGTAATACGTAPGSQNVIDKSCLAGGGAAAGTCGCD